MPRGRPPPAAGAIGGRDAPPGPRPSVIEPPTAWRSEAAPTRTDAVPRLADITGSEESSRCLAMHPSGFGLRALCAALLGAWPAASGYAPPTKYLLVSDAVNGNIAYAKLTSPGVAGQMTPLITKGLVHPQGIAVDQKRQLLLVADSEPKKVFSYGLIVAGDGTLKVRGRHVCTAGPPWRLSRRRRSSTQEWYGAQCSGPRS
ncbi:unnamed protein product [Prorocentrum cordatum]|uniref:Phytase-like domain-containing protein n=1 Tax=Prorocentrum cordatum TaxID=2364126 RepID=A0ABN9XYX0_9DINO|nr:unnamed protein product [Polarella glacialis]